MTDVGKTIAPKSDQLNADDLIAGPITIRITKVSAASAEQPVAINFEGDGGKPYMPCKSMRRVLVQVWGRDGSSYVGKRLTLYRDPAVRFGGIEVGGIRISHMSDIDSPRTMALTATRASRKPFTVAPLKQTTEQPSSPPPPPPQAAGEAAGAPPEPSGAPAHLFTMVDSKGEKRTTTDGAAWADALAGLIEKKPFDAAERLWRENKDYVDAAFAAGHGQPATRVEAAWRRRAAAAKDTARGG